MSSEALELMEYDIVAERMSRSENLLCDAVHIADPGFGGVWPVDTQRDSATESVELSIEDFFAQPDSASICHNPNISEERRQKRRSLIYNAPKSDELDFSRCINV